jgi:hypothetical protein
MARTNILAAHFCVLYLGFIPPTLYMLYAFLTMIIVLQPCYEVMNHCALPC